MVKEAISRATYRFILDLWWILNPAFQIVTTDSAEVHACGQRTASLMTSYFYHDVTVRLSVHVNSTRHSVIGRESINT